jgi:capsular exopolysaccharide synthesis family protein
MAPEKKIDTTQTTQQDSINVQDILYLCLAKWYWFVVSLVICLGVATYYLLSTPPVYTREASILIKDDTKGSSVSPSAIADLGMFTTVSNVANEMGTMRSPDLMVGVVTNLHLDMDYQVEGRFHRQTLYGNQLPVRVSLPDFSDNEFARFTLNLIGDGTLKISDFEHNDETIKEVTINGVLNDSISTPIGTIVISSLDSLSWVSQQKIYVTRMPIMTAANSYANRLTVERKDKESNIINLSFLDVSPRRAEEVLAMLIAVYNEDWIKNRNQMAVSTSMFINDRLGVIENELGNVDNDISSFKSEHLMPDVQAAANMYMNQATSAEASVRELNNQVYMVRYIKNYLANANNKYELLPANTGIADAGIASQISEYNSKILERNGLVSHSSDRNPLVVELDASLVALRQAMMTTLDNQLVALNTQIKSLQSVSGQAISQIASNPQQSKYLLSVERQQKVKEALYLYLLQKREENELSQAFTAYNTHIITKPAGSMIPTSPVAKNILLIAFVIGLLFPVGIIYLREFLDTRVRGRKDLENLSVPFVGEIPQYGSDLSRFRKGTKKEKNLIVVREGNRDIINEAFRVIRTNLEFMAGKECDGGNVLVMTSFNAASGKSFLTMNIALSLAIKGKKVLVIDGDLRHGSTSSYIGFPNQGLSDYLGSKLSNIEEIFVKDQLHENLDVLPIGTIPPNPTELLFSKRLKQIVDYARTHYEFVFIDCPPIELVADTQIIEQLADRTIFVVRAGLLERSMLGELEKLYQEKKYKNMSIILNGTKSAGSRHGYRYGYRYGYHYGYGYGYHYGSDKK